MLFVYLIGGLLPMILVCIYLMNSTQNEQMKQRKDSEIFQMQTIGRELSEAMELTEAVSKHFDSDVALEKIAKRKYVSEEEFLEDSKNYRKLNRYKNYYGNLIQQISVYIENDSMSGDLGLVSVKQGNRMKQWYKGALTENGRSYWSYLRNYVNNDHYLALTRLLKNASGEEYGILMIRLKNSKLLSMLNNRENREDREVERFFVLNQEMIITSEREKSDHSQLLALLEEYKEDTLFQKVQYKGETCAFSKMTMQVGERLTNVQIVSIEPYHQVTRESRKQRNQSIKIIVCCVAGSGLLILLYSRYISRRVSFLTKQMNRAANGDFDLAPKMKGKDEFSEIYKDLNRMIADIQKLLSKVYKKLMIQEQLKSRQKDAEFKMLSSQINPHFLYNTLETIRMKARSNGQSDIEELVKMLAKILRRNIQVGSEAVSLQSEVELLEYYLKIQQYRFGERVKYEIDISCDIATETILPLVLQPLVENAVVHGLETKTGQGMVWIRIRKEKGLCIMIEDNGVGMEPEKLQELIQDMNDYTKSDQTHIGIRNVNQRIRLYYGQKYGLQIYSQLGKGTRIVISLPESIDLKEREVGHVSITDYR